MQCIRHLNNYYFYTIHCSCFISHMEVLWGTFLAPIFAVMLFNLVVFICIIVVLIRHKMGRVKRKQEQMTARTVLRLMFSIGCVMFLFGLTWLFAILIFSSSFPVLRLIFLILFTVFNSLQGFFIFVFVLNAEILNCCRKVTSQRESKSSQSRSRATTRKQSESDNRKRLNTFSTTIQSSDELKPNRKTKRSQQKRNEKTHDESVQMTYID